MHLKNAGKNILFVTAAGNYHINNDESPVYPGSIGLPNVLTVSASDKNNLHTEWTQFGEPVFSGQVGDDDHQKNQDTPSDQREVLG